LATILFVEDQKQMAEMFKSVLTAKGYDVIVIHHGSQALELIEENADDIDILVTDIVLPGVSGISLAHKLRSRRPESCILLITGYSELQAEDIGFPVLGKPFTPNQLLEKIEMIQDNPFTGNR